MNAKMIYFVFPNRNYYNIHYVYITLMEDKKHLAKENEKIYIIIPSLLITCKHDVKTKEFLKIHVYHQIWSKFLECII